MRAAAAALLVLMAVGTAGCGRKPLSTPEFQLRARSICLAERARSAQVPRPQAPADVPSFVSAALQLVRPAVDKLGALRAPDELRPRYETAVGLLRRRLGLLDDAAKKLRDGAEPLATVATLQTKLAPLRREGARQWPAIGLPECARP
ncbi:MAG: hypothetical protein ACR2K9_08375 [Solirubrobacteraceae bacterium]